MPLETTIDLMLGQYRAAPKLRTTIQIVLDALEGEVAQALRDLAKQRRIETAEGVWLDFLGRRLGVRRPHISSPTVDPRFGFDMAGVGFSQGPFVTSDPANRATGPLGDVVFRRLLRARAITLLGDGAFGTLERSVHAVDEDASVRDLHNMTVRVVTAIQWQLELADKQRCLARNAGVRIVYADRARFGFDEAGVPFDVGPFVGGSHVGTP